MKTEYSPKTHIGVIKALVKISHEMSVDCRVLHSLSQATASLPTFPDINSS